MSSFIFLCRDCSNCFHHTISIKHPEKEGERKRVCPRCLSASYEGIDLERLQMKELGGFY